MLLWELLLMAGAAYAHLVVYGISEVKQATGVACFTVPPAIP